MSLTIKAQIGVSSFNILNVTFWEWSGIAVGTIIGYLNVLFGLVSYLLDPRKDKREYGLMVFSVVFLSYAINFFVYVLLPYVQLEAYFLRIFVLGIFLVGVGIGRILHYGVLQFPLEKCCQLLAERSQKLFSYFRYRVDLFCVVFSLLHPC